MESDGTEYRGFWEGDLKHGPGKLRQGNSKNGPSKLTDGENTTYGFW